MPTTEHRLLFVTGASGVGKTSTLRLLQQHRAHILVRCIDSSVPTRRVMLDECGSAEEWQRQKTIGWIKSEFTYPCSRHLGWTVTAGIRG
jgi:hypothetical protein